MRKDNVNNGNDMSVHSILQQIRDGQIDPRNFSKGSRQMCVETLRLEGYQTSAIAHLLRVSDRTVRRDIEEIRKRNILEPDVDFARELIGEVYMFAKQHHMYLMRLARTNSSSVSERALAEAAAWRVLKEMLEKFQELGYVPKTPTKIVGNFYQYTEALDIDKLSEKDKKILTEIRALTPMDRGKLIKNLENRIMEMDEEENTE